ncbi:MAG: hypothetical protein H6658_05535 [Ardenticatenaceae bacterium]|nr:hypothetical protein [Ardenticatenaceae bacterium]
MATLHIHLFGQLRLFWDERPYPFKALPKAEPLLAYLLLHPQTPTQRHSLAFKLWPDATEKQAKGRLRRHLYNLRHALPPTPDEQPWLLITAQTVQWNPAAPYWLDVAAFEHLSQQPPRLAEAIALYTGPLLPDIDETWLFLAREQWHRQFLHNLTALLEQNWQQQDYRQALIYAQQALAEDAHNEEIARQQMALHAALGERTTALQRYHEFVTHLQAELNIEPMAATTAVYHAIQQNHPPDQLFTLAGFAPPSTPSTPPPAPSTHNIPTPLTPLIGRTTDLAQITNWLSQANPKRLITLTGTAGIGKTRLALAAAQKLLPASPFTDGLYLIPLASAQHSRQVLPAIADVLQVKPDRDNHYLLPLITRLRYQQILLILDNLEHLLDCAPDLLHLLETVPGLTLLITSQMPLHVKGEHIYPLSPLQLPETSPHTADYDQLSQIEAIALFLAVARSVQPHFRLSSHNAAHIITICRQLDGLPLAIELAAARSQFIPPDVMAAQLHQHTHLLATRATDVPSRHRSLQAAIQWSFELLTAVEQHTFTCLALFPDSFSPAAVAAIMHDKPINHPTDLDEETLNQLENLLHKNLLYPLTHNRVEGELRFALLTTLRSFAHEKLQTLPEIGPLQARYVRYYAHLAQQATSQIQNGRPQNNLARLHLEENNMVQALEWSVGQQAQAHLSPYAEPLITSLHIIWRANLRYAQTAEWLKRAFTFRHKLPPYAYGTLLSLAGYVWGMQGHYAQAFAYLDEALALARQIESTALLSSVLGTYGTIASHQGDKTKALQMLQAALDTNENAEQPDAYRSAVLQHNMAILQFSLDDFEAGIETAEKAFNYYTTHHQEANSQDTAMLLADLYFMQGNRERGLNIIRQAFAQAQASHNHNALLSGISTIADYLFRLEIDEPSLILNTANQTLSQQKGFAWPQYYQQIFAETVSSLRQRLGHERFVACWAEGARMTLAQAIHFALTTLDGLP